MGEREILKVSKMMKRIFCFAMMGVMVASMLLISGCGTKTEEEYISKPVKLYFINEAFVETGDESKGVLVEYDGAAINEIVNLPKGITPEESASSGYEATINKLCTVPEELKDVTTVITEDFTLLDITCKDGTAYVDLVGKDLQGKGGSFEETVFISQIVETLISSFEEIERVQFLVDGENAETLMGHCDTSEPFTGSLFQ